MHFNNLSIINKIKDGGQKSVFLAQHPSLNKVVYKHCKISSNSDSERITREIDFLKSTSSPYFPKIFDTHLDKLNNNFEIMEEYIDGGALSDRLDHLWLEKDIIAFLKQLIIPVAILWEKRIVHRDIKPDNIMFRNNGSLVLIDLGIARFLDKSSLTKTINIYGPCTPIYAAPEQLVNQKRNIDFRTDQFAIGITLLQLFLGFHPFDPNQIPGCTANIIQNIMTGVYYSPQLKGGCSSSFCTLIQKLLKNRQYQRFAKKEDLIMFIDSNWGRFII